MPIRIMRDDAAERHSAEQPDIEPIVVRRSDTAKEADVKTEETKLKAGSESPPSQTTWAMVGCQCTLTQRSYQLAFRKEGGTYVLRSIDRQLAPTASKDMSGIEGSFDWRIFACPECARTWRRSKKEEAVPPVIYCTCRSLFCTARGLQKQEGKSGDEWWWSCPKCGIHEQMIIESIP